MATSAAQMVTNYKAGLAALDPPIIFDNAKSEAVLTVMFQAIIDDIVANSELVPITTDTGSAGAGIITGKVK